MSFNHIATHLVVSSDMTFRSEHAELADAVAAAENLNPEVLPAYIVHATKVTEAP